MDIRTQPRLGAMLLLTSYILLWGCEPHQDEDADSNDTMVSQAETNQSGALTGPPSHTRDLPAGLPTLSAEIEVCNHKAVSLCEVLSVVDGFTVGTVNDIQFVFDDVIDCPRNTGAAVEITLSVETSPLSGGGSSAKTAIRLGPAEHDSWNPRPYPVDKTSDDVTWGYAASLPKGVIKPGMRLAIPYQNIEPHEGVYPIGDHVGGGSFLPILWFKDDGTVVQQARTCGFTIDGIAWANGETPFAETVQSLDDLLSVLDTCDPTIEPTIIDHLQHERTRAYGRTSYSSVCRPVDPNEGAIICTGDDTSACW